MPHFQNSALYCRSLGFIIPQTKLMLRLQAGQSPPDSSLSPQSKPAPHLWHGEKMGKNVLENGQKCAGDCSHPDRRRKLSKPRPEQGAAACQPQRGSLLAAFLLSPRQHASCHPSILRGCWRSTSSRCALSAARTTAQMANPALLIP